MSARQHCTAARAVLEARRAAGPFNRTIFAGGASLGPQPAAQRLPIVQVVSEICGNSLPAPRTRRRGVFLRQRSSIKHCGAQQHGAAWGSTPHSVSSLVIDGTHLAANGGGGFLCASGGALRTLPEHLVNEFAQHIRAGRDISGIFMQYIGAQHVEPLQPVAINLHFKSLGSARVWSRHGRIRKSWFHRNIRFSRFIVNDPEETPLSLLTFLTYGTYYHGINNSGAAMNFKLSTLAAAAALLVNCSAMAEMAPIGTIGFWKLTADETLCKAQGYYENGTYLSFHINANAAASIAIANEKWRIPEGMYGVSMQVDRAAPVTYEAKAGPQYVVWQIPLDETTTNLLSYGRTLYVTVGKQTLQYELTRSEAVLKALIACIGPRIGNPYAGQPSASAPPANPFAETTSNPYRRM